MPAMPCLTAANCLLKRPTWNLITYITRCTRWCSPEDMYCWPCPTRVLAWTRKRKHASSSHFFTTKVQGKGTGLGLATVYGVVKQSGGYVWVYSEVGNGTSFKIYLPRVDQIEEEVLPAISSEAPRGAGTILLAEDEQEVREVAKQFLESGGYTVLEARDGLEAVRIAEQHDGIIHLLVTDMVMPGMTGRELATCIQERRQGLHVIFMSGYSEYAAVESSAF